MKIYKLFYSAALLAMTACTANDDLRQECVGGETLVLTATQSQTVSGQISKTRASDGLYISDTGFDGTEKVKVYFNDTDADYRVGTPDASKENKSTLYGNTLTYPAANTGSASLYAVYPATSAATGSHTVAYDQTTDAAYKQSDLMFAKTDVDLSDKHSAQNLDFKHELVKLVLNVTKCAEMEEITKIELKNVKRTVAITPSATELTQGTRTTADDTYGDNLLIFSGNITDTDTHTFAVVFPAQAWDGNTFIEMSADGYLVTYTLDKSDWTNGAEYTIDLDIDYNFLDATVSINRWYDGGDLFVAAAPKSLSELKAWVNSSKEYNSYIGYYVSRTGAIHSIQQSGDIGCIAYISTSNVDAGVSGSRILVMATADANTTTVAWASSGTSSDTTGDDSLNGFTNTQTLQAIGQSEQPAAYGAWNYISARPQNASNWFLPSKAQLNAMSPILATKLGIATNATYWTSTEKDATTAWAYSIDGEWLTAAKSSTNHIRACFAY